MFSCFFCQSSNINVVATPEQIRHKAFGFEKNIIQCLDCGLVQVSPMWNEEESSYLYNYYSNNNEKHFKKYKDKKTDTKRVGYKELIKYIPNKDSKILEIGCGDGFVMEYLKENGYKNILGIERDPSVCDGINVLNWDFLATKFGDIKYDFIYALCVFNYINEPIKFLQKMIGMLEDKGVFFLETYNYDDPLGVSFYNNKSFNKFRWDPYNSFYYDRKTITYMLDSFDNICYDIFLRQRYGILNHLRWNIFGKPSVTNYKIPILDKLYAKLLNNVFKVSDTMIVVGKKI